MKDLALLALSLCAALSVGCSHMAQYGPVPLYISGVTNVDLAQPFDADEARRLVGQGSHSLSGTAAMKLVDGKNYFCSNTYVFLIPATAYAAERMQHLFGDPTGGFRRSERVLRFRPDTPEYVHLQRSTLCSPTGSFKFDGVPAGDFYVVALVDVFIGSQNHGGQVMQRVQVSKDTALSILF